MPLPGGIDSTDLSTDEFDISTNGADNSPEGLRTST
jgi:hypothetical protein